MRKSKYTVEQIIGILRESQGDITVKEVCRRHNLTQTTFYKWRQKFGGLEVNEAKRLRLIEDENHKLKKLVANRALDMMVLKDLLSKKF